MKLLKRKLMLKAGISQEELDGKPRDLSIKNGLRLNDLQGKEIP